MKCDCEECGGTGQIECPECEGTGGVEGHIDQIPLEKRMRAYDVLVELQADARRAKVAAARLAEMKPEYAASYEAQLKTTLREIDRQADAACEAAA